MACVEPTGLNIQEWNVAVEGPMLAAKVTARLLAGRGSAICVMSADMVADSSALAGGPWKKPSRIIMGREGRVWLRLATIPPRPALARPISYTRS